jgi:hypothetical protein
VQIWERRAPNAHDVLDDRAGLLISMPEIGEVLGEEQVNLVDLAFVPKLLEVTPHAGLVGILGQTILL